MNDINDLLDELELLDIKLWVEDSQLCYDAPNDVITDSLLGKIIKNKQEIIKALTKRMSVVKQLPAIVNTGEYVNDIPLSFNQEQLWFFYKLRPDSSVYNIPGAISIKGNIDIKILEYSLNELVKKHESLRTIFSLVEGRPVQNIISIHNMSLSVEDLLHIPEADRETVALKLAKVEAKQPFNLESGPLFRFKLWILGSSRHILQSTVHHIISDGWSMGILMRELLEIYEHRYEQKDIQISKPVIQYKDFSIWQRNIFDKGLLANQLEYWKNELSATPRLMDLPADRTRPSVKSFLGDVRSFSLEKHTYLKLKKLSISKKSSMFQILLAAFQVLIYRYTGYDDFVIGFLSSNRSYETKDTMGYFVNTLPLHLRFSGELSFRNILSKTKEALLQALNYGDIPFIKIVELFKTERSLSYNPIFQILVAHEDEQSIKSGLLDLEFKYFLVDYEKSKFDLTLFINEENDNFKITLEYDSDIFEGSTIDRMLNSFDVLLNSIVENPDFSISNLSIISKEGARRLLIEWNDTFRQYPLEKTLHELFEEQAERTPDVIALTYASATGKINELTYAELNYKANQVSQYLKSLGAKPDMLVGILMERSLEMVIGLLGILKSGAAYVPLDPEYPSDRLAFMLEDAQVPVLLTQEYLSTKLPDYSGTVVYLDRDWRKIALYSGKNLKSDAAAESLAYVIYTSGSTGQPKGAMNIHKGICNRLIWMQEAFQLTADDCVLQKTPYSFDVSVWEFFWPLITGARLVIAKPGGHRDNLYLINLIVEQKITTLHFVPSMLRLFLESEGVEKCNCSLKCVICSGEALSFELQEHFFELLSAELYNLYGPTEAAIDVIWWHCRKEHELRIVPIGKPIANTQIYILDSQLQPVPVGVTGELYIGGFNLARGYWNRHELTSEKFIRNPYAGDINAKMYKTGDRARYLPDGNIEFLGRTDYQVKIRGFRIELGEIEITLRQYPLIDEAIVIAEEDVPGTNILIAYISLNQGNLSISGLRDFLMTRLPEYMIPAAFVILDDIPLTSNGKVNRSALPLVSKERPLLGTAFVEPQTGVEKTLANIWEKVLKIDQVGIHDKFFELGGDSIRSIQVLYMAKEKGLYFTLQDIFHNQSIYTLSQLIKAEVMKGEQERKAYSFSLISEEDRSTLPEGLEDAYPLSMLQTGLVFHSNHSPEYSSYITSYYLRTHFDLRLFQQALNMLISRHPMLRTSFDFIRYSKPLQLVHRFVDAHIFVEDLRHLSTENQTDMLYKWIESERKRKFDWENAPLFRFYAHLRTEETFQFSVVEPILDGWSVALLSSELFSIYKNILRNENEISGDELFCSYRDYVALEQESLLSEECKNFWREKLNNSTKTLLPRWPFENICTKKPQLIRKQITVPSEIDAGIKKVAHFLSVPIKSVLLAAHIRVIQVLSGQTDVLTGLLMNGRPEKRGGEQVIGNFLNAVPFRSVTLDGSWYDLIKEIYTAETEILPFRRYPLAQIQLEQGGTLFDTVFNFIHFYPYQEFHDSDFELIGIKANDQTYFPLTVQFSIDWHTSNLRLSLDYNANEFCEKQIEYIADYLLRALSKVADAPEEDYLHQSLLSENEQQKLFYEWNNTYKDLPHGKCFHELFEEQADITPNNIAVADIIRQLTYHELNAKANRAARTLVEFGVKSDTVVTILAHRDTDFVTTLLGIFKAGGAYLPLHPEWPALRIHQILQQSRSNIIVTTQEFISVLNEALNEFDQENRPCVIDINTLLQKSQCETNLNLQYSPNDLAYVIYTSGSTGIPKGAMVEHAGMLNHLFAKIEDLQLNGDSITAQTASQSFDISIWQFFANLLVGGRVEIAESNLVQDPIELIGFIRNKSINVFETVPSLLKAIIDVVNSNRIPSSSLHSLKWLIVTGEAFPSDLCKEWFDIFPQIPVINAYGPTECSDDVTHYIMTSPPDVDIPIVPIGKPIRNTKIYILDNNLEPVSIGVPGELFVGGIGVGRGYLNDNDQTKESFLSDRFTQQSSSARLYKTGDLARFLSDGEIEFLGRIDHQVKIRGFRIEIGEIENVLRQYESVKDAVVIVRDISGKEELVAYVVFKSDYNLNTAEMRTFLRQQLPEYMVPSIFVQLHSMPINQNGKVDRKALPEPVQVRPDLDMAFSLPCSMLEKILASIWEQVLGIERIGINENFFDLGGHSLQAVQLVSKISNAVNRNISVNFLLLHPSVAELAEAIEKLELIDETPISRKERSSVQYSPSAYIQFENRSLQRLFNVGKIEPVDAAALGYLPDSLLVDTGLPRDEIVNDWMGNLPEIRRIFTTPLGRISHITLPIFASEIFSSQDRLLDIVTEGIDIAGLIGARTVSLTGLLPSATNYGQAVVNRISGGKNIPIISTGHATTVTAVIFSIEKILAKTGRKLSNERVGFLGMGSIGTASLWLMIKVLPQPHEITLCDVYGKLERLEDIKKEINLSYGFTGKINIITSRVEVPAEFYDSTLIIGAASMKDTIDVWKLKPGTIIVDDSAPHCFDFKQARLRLESEGDILFTEGGILKSPEPISELRYLPRPDYSKNPFANMVQYRNSEYEIMGCIFSSILSSALDDLKPIIGLPGIDVCLQHYNRLRQLGYEGSELCCRDYALSQKSIVNFRKKYGNING